MNQTTWYKLTYDHRDGAIPLGISIAFVPGFLAANQSLEFAVFIRKEPSGRHSTLYFTPAAASLVATNRNAIPCGQPSPEGIDLYAGEQASLALFFPSP